MSEWIPHADAVPWWPGLASSSGPTTARRAQIAPLDAHHHGDAVALWHETGPTRRCNDPRGDLERAIAGAASTVLAAVDPASGRLLGTAMVGDDGHRGWVHYLAVSPGAQRAGLGRALMWAAEQWLARRGVVKLDLMIRSDNAAVQGFYRALGYEREDVLVMSRRLVGEDGER